MSLLFFGYFYDDNQSDFSMEKYIFGIDLKGFVLYNKQKDEFTDFRQKMRGIVGYSCFGWVYW